MKRASTRLKLYLYHSLEHFPVLPVCVMFLNVMERLLPNINKRYNGIIKK